MSTEAISSTMTEAATSGVLGTLGVNWKIFIAQLVNFGVVLLILWRWVYRPVVRLLDERSKKIEDSVRRAEEIEKTWQQVDGERLARLREAEQKAQVIITEAIRVGEASREEAATKARAEVEKIVKQGKETLVTERERMLTAARGELAGLVIAATEKVLAEKIDEKQDRKLVEKVLQTL